MTGLHTTDDGCRIAYTLEGDEGGELLVLMNSLGTTRVLWERPLSELSRHFRVLRFDNRGHGESDVPPGDYTIERLARDAVSLMDGLAVPRAHVAGVSIGGQMALWLAIHAPDRVDRLVLLNTGARIQSVEFWNERIETVRAKGVEALADVAIGRWFTENFRKREPAAFTGFRNSLAATPAAGYIGCCAALRDADLRKDAAKVKARTLVITGRHDQSTPPELGYWLRDHIPGAELVEVEAAHLSPVEAPFEVTSAMVHFLREQADQLRR